MTLGKLLSLSQSWLPSLQKMGTTPDSLPRASQQGAFSLQLLRPLLEGWETQGRGCGGTLTRTT